MEFNWQTDYDASQMYVSLWENPYGGGASTCIWSQTQSGAQAYTTTLDLPVIDFSYYFLVTVVPEPSAFVCLVAALAVTVAVTLRRSSGPRIAQALLLGCVLTALGVQANASLQSSDVVVLFNSSVDSDGWDWSVSREIADAYAAARAGCPRDRCLLAVRRRIHTS